MSDGVLEIGIKSRDFSATWKRIRTYEVGVMVPVEGRANTWTPSPALARVEVAGSFNAFNDMKPAEDAVRAILGLDADAPMWSGCE
jgi:hypothetical protein